MNLRYLSRSEHYLWDSFINHSCQYSIFNSTWLLDEFEKQYDVLVAEDSNGIVGGIVLSKNKLRLQTNPLHFKYQGVIIKNFRGKEINKSRKENKVISVFASYLKRFSTFDYSFSPCFSNWLPFYWNGFSQSVQYTYRIDLALGIDAIRSNYSDNRKRCLKKSESSGAYIKNGSCLELYSTLKETFLAQGRSLPISLDYLNKYFNLTNNFFCLSAFTENQKLCASCGVLFDSECAYLLFNGVARGAGPVNTLLIHEAIKRCIGSVRIFDFEGSMYKRIEYFYRGMGGVQTPYFKVWKKSAVNTMKIIAKSIYINLGNDKNE